MPDSADPVRAAVYFDTKEAREQAEKALGPLPPSAEGTFSGVAEGEFDPAAVKQLDEAGLVVELLDQGAAGAAAESPAGPAKAVAENAALIEEFKQQASTASFSADESRLVLGAEPAASDPRLHHLGDYDATPTPAEALPEDAYNIRIRGRITRAQRLQLDDLGVDIAAFEPGHGYRAFLSREQYAAVLELPYVTGVSRYGVAQAVTPELLDAVDEVAGGEPGAELMSGGQEAAPAPQTFDCIVHREEDLEQIRSLIDQTAGTEVLDASNLRVRFSAEPHLPFLAALAALPEVRKLAPFEAPTL